MKNNSYKHYNSYKHCKNKDLVKLIKLWNSFAKKKAEENQFVVIEYCYNQVISRTNPVLTEDMIFEAVENYKKALSLRNSQAPHHLLANFLSKYLDTYLEGYFDIEHFDRAKYAEKEKVLQCKHTEIINFKRIRCPEFGLPTGKDGYGQEYYVCEKHRKKV